MISRDWTAIRVAAATVALAWTLCGGAAEAGLSRGDAARRFGPDVTLYASFEKRAGLILDREMKIARPQRGLSIWMQSGVPGVYPEVDYSISGAPPLYPRGLVAAKDGRFGDAVRLGKPGEWKWSSLVLDAVGNLFAERGTICFWARWTKKAPTRGTKGYLLDVTPMRAYGGYSYTGIYIERGRLTAYVVDALGRSHSLRSSIAAAGIKRGQWTHFALAWDCTKGLTLCVDGKPLASNWGKGHWPARVNLEGIALGHMRRSTMAGRFGGALSFDHQTVLDFDELVAFRRALSVEEVAELFQSNRLSRRDSTLPSREEIIAHRARVMEWGPGDGLPRIPASSKLAVVKQVEIRKALAVKRATHIAVDGQWHSSWSPARQTRYSVGNERLELHSPKGGYYNYLRMVCRNFSAGVSGFDSKRKRYVHLYDVPLHPRIVHRMRLGTPRYHLRSLITGKTGELHDLKLFRILLPGRLKRDRKLGKRLALTPTTRRKDSLSSPPKGRRLPRFSAATLFSDAEDRNVIACENRAEAAPFAAKVPAWRFVHFGAPSPKSLTAYDRVELDLSLAGMTSPTRFWLGLWEPVLRERLLWEFDWQAIPASKASPQRLRIRFDIPGVVIQPGQRLRLSLLADRDVQLVSKPRAPSRIVLYAATTGDATDAYCENQLRVVKDVFDMASQPRQWVFGGLPYNVNRALARMLAHLESLGRVRSDWRAAGLYSLLTTNQKSPWSAEFRSPRIYTDIDKLPPEPKDCPAWAFWWRQAHDSLRFVVDWWIANRQIETGEFGGVYSDDTDMVHEWANFAMIWDGDGKLADSFCRLSEFCWTRKNKDGLSIFRNDSDLHCYEEGMNIHGGTLLFRYGDPVCFSRVMLMAQHTDGNLTAVNAKGQRLFPRQTYTAFGSSRGSATDTGIFFRMEPALWLTWYNAHPEATRVLGEWMDTRLAKFPAKNPSGWPGVLRFGDGKDLTDPSESRRRVTYMLSYDALFLLARITGDEKYLRPLKYNMARTARGEQMGVGAGKSWRLYAWGAQLWNRFGKFESIQREPWWPALHKRMADGPSVYHSPYLKPTRDATVQALKDAVRTIKQRRSALTWMGQSPDRVFMSGWPAGAFYHMTLAGTARSRNTVPIPQHAASYENADRNVARWVLRSEFGALALAFYSFHKTPRDILVRPWLLEHGEYSVKKGLDANGDFRPDAPSSEGMTLTRFDTPIRLTLPPGKVFVVEARMTKRLPGVEGLPDPAISARDVEFVAAIPALRIPVHNIGRQAARGVEVVVRDADTGRLLWRKTIDRIDAPLDLAPKTVRLFTGRLSLEGLKRLAVQIDPDARRPDFCRYNNKVVVQRTFPTGRRARR